MPRITTASYNDYTTVDYTVPPTREAELDGTQAIADALEVKDAEPGLSFGGIPIKTDPHAPLGSIYFTNSGLYMYTGAAWTKVTP